MDLLKRTVFEYKRKENGCRIMASECLYWGRVSTQEGEQAEITESKRKLPKEDDVVRNYYWQQRDLQWHKCRVLKVATSFVVLKIIWTFFFKSLKHLKEEEKKKSLISTLLVSIISRDTIKNFKLWTHKQTKKEKSIIFIWIKTLH